MSDADLLRRVEAILHAMNELPHDIDPPDAFLRGCEFIIGSGWKLADDE